jgi:putative endonuclease
MEEGETALEQSDWCCRGWRKIGAQFRAVLNRYTNYDIFLLVPHFFYLARCSDGSLYAGTCIDVSAREAKHNDGTGAKYTRARRPVKIIYTETFETLSEARKREAAVKKLSKDQKEELVK